MICVRDKSTTLSRTCQGLCRKHLDMLRWFLFATFVICVHDFPRGEVLVKVGIMVLGLNSATMDDSTATTVRAVWAQTDSRPIALRSESHRKEFWTVQNSSAIYNDHMATSATDHDHSTILRSAAIWSENWSLTLRSQCQCDWGISVS